MCQNSPAHEVYDKVANDAKRDFVFFVWPLLNARIAQHEWAEVSAQWKPKRVHWCVGIGTPLGDCSGNPGFGDTSVGAKHVLADGSLRRLLTRGPRCASVFVLIDTWLSALRKGEALATGVAIPHPHSTHAHTHSLTHGR